MSRASFKHLADADAAPGVAQLRQTLKLVEQIAGEQHAVTGWAGMLGDDAALAIAYTDIPDIARRRFDAVAAEAAAFAAVGVRALIGRDGEPVARAAAASCLATELRDALGTLAQLLATTARADLPLRCGRV